MNRAQLFQHVYFAAGNFTPVYVAQRLSQMQQQDVARGTVLCGFVLR